MARPEGLEPPTLCSEGRCSIQLSYGRIVIFSHRITESTSLLSRARDSLFARTSHVTPIRGVENDAGC